MKPYFWSTPSLAGRIWIRMGLLAIAAISLLTIQYTQREQNYSRDEISKQAEIMLETTALTMRDSLYALKIDELEDLAHKIDENPEITLFVIYDKYGRELVNSKSSDLAFSQMPDMLGSQVVALKTGEMYQEWQSSQLIAGQPVFIGDKVIGGIAIGFSTKQLAQKTSDLTRQSVFTSLIFIGVGGLLTYIMAKRITTPLSELANVASEMKKGNLNIRAGQARVNDEINLLSIAFNQMADAIQEREKDLIEQAENLEEIVNERTAELQEQARILEELAITDPLTHAYNRRQFYKLAEIEMEQAKRNEIPLSVIVMDADHFKRINDRYGHQAGDMALVRLTEICQSVIRDSDVFARYGGEEFVVLMPKTDKHSAKQVAERIRQKIENTKIQAEGKTVRFTISLGVSTLQPPQNIAFDSLLTQADRALYRSKKLGRNRVTHWADEAMLQTG